MKIFVGYGYNDRDRWIKEMVIPIIEAFGSDYESGEVTYGGTISDAVIDKIKLSDALIAFMTKRIAPDAADGETHLWVTQELAIAVSEKKPFVEVREIGISQQSGVTGGFQTIYYDENARDACLVKIVEALGKLHREYPVRVQLLPKHFAIGDLRPLANKNLLTCQYVIRNGSQDTAPVTTAIKRIRGGLFIDVPPPERNAMIQIDIKHGHQIWSSDYESLDAYGIHLE